MGVYAVAIEGFSAGQVIINSMAGIVIGATVDESPQEAADVAAIFRGAWEDNILARLCNVYQFVGVTARGVLNAEVSGFAAAVNTAGGSAAEPLPTFAAIRWRLQTAQPGRAGRGRTGLSPVPENTTDAAAPNSINAVNRAAYQANADAFLADLNNSLPSVALVVVSRFLNGVPRADPIASLVTSIAVDTRLGTRVSRLR